MKKILTKLGIFTIALATIIGFNSPFVEAVIVDNSNIVNNSWYWTNFDGVDERMYKDSPTGFTSDNTGSFFCYFTFDSVTLANNGFINVAGIGDTNAALNQFNFGARRDDTLFPTDKKRIAILTQVSGSAHEVLGSTDIVAGTLYNLVFVSNGSAWTIYLNGTAETLTTRLGSNSGRWFSDFTWPGTPRWALGNVFRTNSWAPVSIDGQMDNCGITSEQISASQASALYNAGDPVNPCLILDCSLMRSYWEMGDSENSVITTTFDMTGGNNLTSENMENADIQSTNYY